ncbi:MAG: hypothetical protein ACYC1U_00320 [Candidatus Aquicultorales bacterium]
MKEACRICSKVTKEPWLVNIAKFDSLDERSRMRFPVCGTCAKRMMAAMRAVLNGAQKDNPNGDLTLVCPMCGMERITAEPKTPSPCDGCGTIFSLYSAAKAMS